MEPALIILIILLIVLIWWKYKKQIKNFFKKSEKKEESFEDDDEIDESLPFISTNRDVASTYDKPGNYFNNDAMNQSIYRSRRSKTNQTNQARRTKNTYKENLIDELKFEEQRRWWDNDKLDAQM